MIDAFNNKISDKIEMQIAHIMATYADNPAIFMSKLNELVIEWFCKGFSEGIGTEREHQPTKKVTMQTRAGQKGKSVYCPHCHAESILYNFAFKALKCRHCNEEVLKQDWLIT